MHRNLDRRVEALVQLRDPEVARAVCSVLDLALDPRISAWELQSDGGWRRDHTDAAGKRLLDYQDQLIRRHAHRGEIRTGRTEAANA